MQRPDGQLTYANSPLRRSSTSHTSFFVEPPTRFASTRKNNYSYSDLRNASLSSSRSSSVQSTPASSFSLDAETSDDDDEDEIAFPAYSVAASEVEKYRRPCSPDNDESRSLPSPVDEGVSPTATPDPILISEDDTAIRREPSQHVDYLSYEWNEADIWSSWRYIVSQRKVYGQRSRLENASWRTWAKSQFKLKTVSPETLNWLKDYDVTWLYGPLQPAANQTQSKHASEPISRLSKSNSFLNKKPILKKRSMSEVMLQKSLSASSLVKQAAAAVQAQQAKGILLDRRKSIMSRPLDVSTPSIPTQTHSREPVDYFSSRSTSGLQTPDHSERKHIRFDDKVEQCIAVEGKDGDYDDDDPPAWALDDSDDSSDDGVVMMKNARKKRPLLRTDSRSSFSGENKTIAKLPSTTLKYRTDSPDVPDHSPNHSLGHWRSSGLSPSPSQETLRPSNPSTNFLLADDDDDDEDEDEVLRKLSESSGNAEDTGTGMLRRSHPSSERLSTSAATEAGGLRRTASGMFMPIEEQDEELVPPGLIGRVVDTVNTARDIAHVIWNVGWRN